MTKRQFCAFEPLGPCIAASTSASSVSSGTGSGRSRRIARQVYITSKRRASESGIDMRAA